MLKTVADENLQPFFIATFKIFAFSSISILVFDVKHESVSSGVTSRSILFGTCLIWFNLVFYKK